MTLDLSASAKKRYETLRHNFVYRKDKVDSYRVLDIHFPKGDCDDYGITTAYIFSGNSVLAMLRNFATGNIELQTGTLNWNGERHLRVKVNGLDSFTVCNIWRGIGFQPKSISLQYHQDGTRGVLWTILKLAVGKVFP